MVRASSASSAIAPSVSRPSCSRILPSEDLLTASIGSTSPLRGAHDAAHGVEQAVEASCRRLWMQPH